MIRKNLRRAQQIKEKSVPFWKDKNFIMWALPIIVPSASVIFDSTYLSYFDIPILFAEINLYIILYVFIAMIVLILVLNLGLLAAQTLADSKHSLLKVLVQPVPFMVATVLAIFDFFLYHSYWNAVILYLLLVSASMLIAVFDDKKIKYSNRVNSQFQFLATGVKVINTPAGRIYERTGTLVFYLLVALLAMLVSENIASRYDMQVLKDEPNTIVIKRNNNVFILKKYDPATNILEEGYQLASIDTHKLELMTIVNPRFLKSKSDVEYSIKEKQRQEKDEKEIENSLNNLIRYFEVIKLKIHDLITYLSSLDLLGLSDSNAQADGK